MFKSNLKYYFTVLIFINFFIAAKSWDSDELEIFDLVEEVNENFYKLMGLSEDASMVDVKRAFRNLSIILHPDKSDAEDANIKFRNLVSVYDVLKDKSKREKYDKVLREGLPNWKSALYYYRRVKKMGLTEGSLIIFVIISIGQYFFAWAAYLERKYTAEQIIGSKLKKLQKRNKSNIDIDSILGEIPTPSILNTLPFQIPKVIWYFPYIMKDILKTAYEYKQVENEKKKMIAEEISERRLLEEELIKEREAKKEIREKIRKRKNATNVPDKTDEDLIGYSQLTNTLSDETILSTDNSKGQLSGGVWTDDDFAELVHLVKKYPGGTLNRWEIISQNMNRSVSEVTYMSAKLKDASFKVNAFKADYPKQTTSETKINNNQKENILVLQKNWSQEQQRALEIAITKYRKGSNLDRWQKIANNVPGKSKEECLQRYKYLVELIKLQKCKEISQNENIEMNTDNPSLIQQNNLDTESQNEILESKKEKLEEISCNSRSGGKPKNKRRENKKQFTISSEDDSTDNESPDCLY